MARLDSWLSADVTHALGWALIHSLWQCLGLAALAAILMAFSRRPPIRYLVATAALVAMLAAPIATFLVLLKPATPVHALLPASPLAHFSASSASAKLPDAAPIALADASKPATGGAQLALDSPKPSLPPNLLPWLVRVWLCALFSLRLAGGFLLLERERSRQFNHPGPRILALCQGLQHELGLTRAIRYLECGWLQAPAVIGWIRPIILLPVWAATGLSETQLRAVIAHELAHIRRHDSIVNLLQILVETLLFYHPAIWWLNRRIRAERELCCDEIAVSLTGDRLEYAKALTLMAGWGKAPALAMAANRGPLSGRIVHILGVKPFSARQRLLGLAGGFLFFAAAMGGAHALFGTPYPIPATRLHASLKRSPSSSHGAIDRMARAVLPAQKPAEQSPDRGSGNDATGGKRTAPDRMEAMANSPARLLVVHLADLSRLLPLEARLTPVPVAFNASPTAPSASPALAAQNAAPAHVLPSIAYSADLQDVPGSDLKTVKVAINGRPRQFLLDIGTKPTEVSQATVTDLALPDVSRVTGSTFGNDLQPVAVFNVKDGRSAEDYRPHVRIGSFTIGDATDRNLAFVVANDPAMGRSKPYDGLMTGDFFRQYDVELDFARNKLNYLTPTAWADPDQVAYWPHAAVAVIPITNWGGKIQVMVSIQGQTIPAVIDTSSPHTVMRRDIAELMLGLKADTPDMAPDGDVTDGTGLRVYRHTFSQIAFAGGVTAYNVPALIQTNSMIRILDRTPILGSRAQFVTDPRQRIPGLTLGMDVLSQLHLYIAYGQQKLYVTGQGAAPDATGQGRDALL